MKSIRLSDDNKRLDVQFFWLAKGNHTSEVGILQRPSLTMNLYRRPNRTMVFNVDTLRAICSGDEISLETSDPEKYPLSDVGLLEMQWFLNRVAVMSGAVEPQG